MCSVLTNDDLDSILSVLKVQQDQVFAKGYLNPDQRAAEVARYQALIERVMRERNIPRGGRL